MIEAALLYEDTGDPSSYKYGVFLMCLTRVDEDLYWSEVNCYWSSSWDEGATMLSLKDDLPVLTIQLADYDFRHIMVPFAVEDFDKPPLKDYI